MIGACKSWVSILISPNVILEMVILQKEQNSVILATIFKELAMPGKYFSILLLFHSQQFLEMVIVSYTHFNT